MGCLVKREASVASHRVALLLPERARVYVPVMVGVMVPRTRSPVPEGSVVILAVVSWVVVLGARLEMPSRCKMRIEGLAGSPVHCSAVRARANVVMRSTVAVRWRSFM